MSVSIREFINTSELTFAEDTISFLEGVVKKNNFQENIMNSPYSSLYFFSGKYEENVNKNTFLFGIQKAFLTSIFIILKNSGLNDLTEITKEYLIDIIKDDTIKSILSY